MSAAERRLAAILAAEVVRYPCRLAADEDGTLARLSRLSRAIMQPAVAALLGRALRLTGVASAD